VSLAEKDAPAALACFMAALQANPHSWPALESAAYVLAEKLDRLSDAIAMLDRAVKMFPEKTACVANRGVLLARAGNASPALQDARTVLAMESTPAIHYQVACIFSLLAKDNAQHKEQALEHLSSALLQGYGAQLVGEDPDLNMLRADPRFLKLQSAVQTLKQNSTAH
jgi:tetratricopeptide (TPR) repeat protein